MYLGTRVLTIVRSLKHPWSSLTNSANSLFRYSAISGPFMEGGVARQGWPMGLGKANDPNGETGPKWSWWSLSCLVQHRLTKGRKLLRATPTTHSAIPGRRPGHTVIFAAACVASYSCTRCCRPRRAADHVVCY